MIFAAGFGTRMGALTKSLPKPLIKIAGKPLIDHALDIVGGIHPVQIVANVHYHAELLADHLTPKAVVLSHEADILETGGGLRAALPLLGDGPVYTLNPDVIWQGPNPLQMLRDAWAPEHMDALLMCVPMARALGHAGTGDFDAGDDGQLRRGSALIYGGAQILKTHGLAEIAEAKFSLNVLWDYMARKNRLYCRVFPGFWCDVGRQESISLAESMLAGGNV